MNRLIARIVLPSALAVVGLGFSASSAFADGCNLYTAGATCPKVTTTGDFGGALYYAVDPQPTGTGVIDSFLRLQMKGEEEGYNTDTRPVQFDEKTDPNFTRDLTLAEVPIVTIDGVQYRQFFLDINEEGAGSKALITLDQLEIYTSGSGDITGYDPTLNGGTGGFTGSGETKRYDLDSSVAGADNWINLDYTLNNGGSGKGDMVVYIPNANFAGVSGSSFVTLYSQFGCSPENTIGKADKGTGDCGSGQSTKYISGAGFEEWWTLAPQGTTTSLVPEPGSLLLLGTGAVALLRRRRSTRKA